VLAVAIALAQIEFPMWFWDLLFFDKGGALVVLTVRDVLTVVAGVLALWAWRRPPRAKSHSGRYRSAGSGGHCTVE
jgi:hypothetical protein